MKTLIQNFEAKGIVQPSGQTPPIRETGGTGCHSSGQFAMTALLLGLFLFLFSPAAAHAERNPTNCLGSGLGISLFTSLPDVHIGDTIYYSVNVFNAAFPSCNAGETNPATAGAIQAYIVTPNGVTNSLTLRRTFLAPGDSDFYTNVVSYVVRAQDMLSDGTVRATASDQGDIHQNDTDSYGGGNQGVNTEVNLPCIQIAVQCVGSAGETGAITFSGTVTNCGNVMLVGVTVTNFVNNGAFTVLFPTSLAIGQVATFSGSWVPLNPCSPSTAILVAQGTDQFTSTPKTVTSTANTTCSEVLTPGIKVTKVCPAQPVSPGQLLTFSGSVSNTGNVTLTNIVVLNNQPVANTTVFTQASLAPGAVANFTGSYLAPTNCSVTDTLTGTGRTACGVAVTNTATATCPILTTPAIVVTATCPVTPVVPGGSLTYSGTVSNAGNNTLTNIVVVSDQPVPNTVIFTRSTLAPGVATNFTGTYIVSANACAVTTTFTGTGKDICTLNATTNSVTTACTVTTAPAIGVRLACPAVTASAGGLITYTGVVTNSGNVILNNVTVVNNQASPSTVLTVPSLAVHASASFTASFTAPIDACTVSSTVTATGSDNCTSLMVTNTASSTCPLITTPGLVLTKVCPAQPVSPGQLLTFSGSVSNTGNVTLTNIVVLNNQPASNTLAFTLASLAPGAVANFTGSYLAPTNCSVTDTLTGTGRSTCGIAVTNKVTATCPILTTPQIVVTATCPVTPVVPGGSLTYSGTVSNAGNNTLTNIVVVSDQPVPNTVIFTRSTLAPGVATNFTGTYTVPANACTVTTTFTGTGKDICTLNATTNSVATACTVTTAPAIGVTLACPAVTASAGGLITYTGVVTNSGNVILNNVTVVNNQASPNTVLSVPSLAVHASASFTASFTAPIDACTVSSTVIAIGSDNCTSLMVTNTASSTCPLITTPGLVLTKVCPAQPVSPGQLFTFSGSVSNTGNVTLTNIVVLNNQPASNTLVFTLASLAPGAVTNFTGSYLAPTNCSVTDTLTGTGRSICGTAVTNRVTATCPILTMPAIVVTQVCPTISVLPGGILTYSGTVSNAGNYTLTNIVVVNNRPAANTVIFTRTTLAPGATASFSGSYQVPIDCCIVWSTVTASGQGCDGVTVTDTDTSTCTVLTLPNIVVTKVCTSGILHPGDLLTYSGSVSNAGNVTLLNVTVVSNQPTNSSPLLGPIALAPGESVSYNASYIVPPDFCGSDTVTASGFDMCSYLPVANSVTTTCPVTQAPRLTITQNCPPQPTPRGGLYTFTGSVSNAGNVTLVNVVVTNHYKFDCYTLTNRLVIGPLTLAPGVSANFSGSYTAPWSCCEVVDTLTARGQDRCAGSNVTATATTVCPLLTTPSIAVMQNCPPNPIPMGSVYGYSGYVTNTGDAVLTNVFVFGPQGINPPVLGPIELAPGESAPYSGSYTVPFNTCSVIVTARGQDICAGNMATSLTSCPVATTTLLALTQNCPVAPVVPGDRLILSGSISNAGNITLVNIVVTNNQSGNTPLITVATLAPGSVVNFNGSYVAPATCSSTSTSTATGQSLCGVGVTNAVSTTCLITTAPLLTLTLNCPERPAVPGGLLTYSGSVSNAGNILLTNIVVLNNLSGVTPVFTTNNLAPGTVALFTGSYVAPTNCSAMSLSTATAQSICGAAVTNQVSTTCPILTAPGITITESCSPGPVTNGSSVVFLGSVTNIGNITLTNVFVFSSSSNNTPVLGPITLAPGASAPFAGSYTATGGSTPVTNSIIVTNGSNTITTNNTPVVTTNTVTPVFGTINPVALTYTNRFSVPSDLHGLMFADQDENWGPTLFYTTGQPGSGANTFDTISTISAPAYVGSPSAGYVTNEYSLTLTGYDALTLAAPDVGYGEINFYYLRHDFGGVCHFGVIKAAAASSDGDLPNALANTGFTGLAFAEDNVNGYGANMFYYVRNDATGIAWFGSINPTPGLVATDLYAVGTNFDALVYVTGTPITGWGTNYFAYLRHDSTGSILGTIDPLTQVHTDRMSFGTNFLNALTFTATGVGYGVNSFYYLRPMRITYTTNIVTSYTTNTVTTYTTNSWVSFTPTNTVTVSGLDLCQGRSVVATADCTGMVIPLIISAPAINSDGFFGLSVPTKEGQSYTVQYKNTLNDPAWTDLPGTPVAGTGGILIITDPSAAVQPTRFYRVSMP